MELFYSLSQINISEVRGLAIERAAAEYKLKQLECPEYVYLNYRAEYRFVSILLRTIAQSKEVTYQHDNLPACYHQCKYDLSHAQLSFCLAAWLTPPTIKWQWADTLPTARTPILNYGLAYANNSKAFLVASRDLFGLETADMSDPRYVKLEREKALICTQKIYPDFRC